MTISSARGVFGTTVQLLPALFERFSSVRTSYVSLTDLAAWEAAVEPTTRFFFYLETPANPSTEVADIEALARIARRHGAMLVVDNCLLHAGAAAAAGVRGGHHRPLRETKYLDGQGRVLGGAVLGSRQYVANRCCASAGRPCRRSTPGCC